MRKEQTSHKNEHNTLMCFPLEPVFTRDKRRLPNFMDEATSGLDPVMRDEILDIFLDFVQDEEHSILVSSHITSDLEKIADYITFIDNGRVLMSKPKDELIYEYGIARCKESQFLQMDQSEILTYRKQEYQYEVLVDHKEQIKRKYPDMVVDHATLDEIMLLYIKGERK